MKTLAMTVSWAALAGTIAAPLLFFADAIDLDRAKLWMLLAAVAWFAATPLWMEHDKGGER
jgi:hypothetical protein